MKRSAAATALAWLFAISLASPAVAAALTGRLGGEMVFERMSSSTVSDVTSNNDIRLNLFPQEGSPSGVVGGVRAAGLSVNWTQSTSLSFANSYPDTNESLAGRQTSDDGGDKSFVD